MNSSPKNYLFDLGYHFGEGLAFMMQEYSTDSSWTIFSFEPNPELQSRLMREAERGVIPMPFAVSDRASDEVGFLGEGDDYGKTGEGSRVLFANENHGDATTVRAVNFSAFLRSVVPFGHQGRCVVKMDIEGAEYQVCRSLLQDGTINLIDVLHVEFHDRFMGSESAETTAALILELEKFTKVILHW